MITGMTINMTESSIVPVVSEVIKINARIPNQMVGNTFLKYTLDPDIFFMHIFSIFNRTTV
jgi:hypothetical protein